MTATPNIRSSKAGELGRQARLDLARQEVRNLLLKTPAFHAIPAAQQQEIANNTVKVVDYLIAPEGIPGNKLAQLQKQTLRNDPYALGLADAAPAPGKFTAQGAREGAGVAGAMLREVNFPEFVGGLINGVFHSIVTSSIQQMEAYGRLVADVAKSLNQFRDEHVSENQGRDHIVEQFPDMFMIDVDTGSADGPAPRIRLRDGVDEDAALAKVNSLPLEGGPLESLDLDDPEIEQRLVQSARTQLATSRQQLLATMVLMGINRIVVTDGKISAKVLYDFKAQDNFKYQRSATSFDYERGERITTEEAELAKGPTAQAAPTLNPRIAMRLTKPAPSPSRDASYYAKGGYKTTSTEPIFKIASIDASQEASDAALTTKASLAGTVEVRFKSETFPLEKMADSFQVGHIQNAAKPGASATVAGTTATPKAQPALPPTAAVKPSA